LLINACLHAAHVALIYKPDYHTDVGAKVYLLQFFEGNLESSRGGHELHRFPQVPIPQVFINRTKVHRKSETRYDQMMNSLIPGITGPKSRWTPKFESVEEGVDDPMRMYITQDLKAFNDAANAMDDRYRSLEGMDIPKVVGDKGSVKYQGSVLDTLTTFKRYAYGTHEGGYHYMGDYLQKKAAKLLTKLADSVESVRHNR
jgi:hypothetical protein